MNFLAKMIEMLTGAYNRDDYQNALERLPLQTNIGKLFQSFAWGLELTTDQAEKIKLWDNLDRAEGAVLDRHGFNFGVARNGATDEFYRLLIRIKMIALLSGGDINTVINATSALFNVDASAVDLQEFFPAKIKVYVDADDMANEQLITSDLIAMVLKRVVTAGVGTELWLRINLRGQANLFYGIAYSDVTAETHSMGLDVLGEVMN